MYGTSSEGEIQYILWLNSEKLGMGTGGIRYGMVGQKEGVKGEVMRIGKHLDGDVET